MKLATEHHPVAPRRVTTYYLGRQYVVSTHMVPFVTVRVWQGTHGYTSDVIQRWYRNDMYVRTT
jgi:hypothetical protein